MYVHCELTYNGHGVTISTIPVLESVTAVYPCCGLIKQGAASLARESNLPTIT
jgi:hypothetical protein